MEALGRASGHRIAPARFPGLSRLTAVYRKVLHVPLPAKAQQLRTPFTALDAARPEFGFGWTSLSPCGDSDKPREGSTAGRDWQSSTHA